MTFDEVKPSRVYDLLKKFEKFLVKLLLLMAAALGLATVGLGWIVVWSNDSYQPPRAGSVVSPLAVRAA